MRRITRFNEGASGMSYVKQLSRCNVESKMANLETPLHERRSFKSIQM